MGGGGGVVDPTLDLDSASKVDSTIPPPTPSGHVGFAINGPTQFYRTMVSLADSSATGDQNHLISYVFD